eukprot:Colp12_sorted_trinity150504_noHs@29317
MEFGSFSLLDLIFPPIWPFLQGFVSGLIAMLICVALVFYFYLFNRNPPAIKKFKRPGFERPPAVPIRSQIGALEPESCEWFNAFLTHAFVKLRASSSFYEYLMTKLNNTLTSSLIPNFITSINIKELSLGDEPPVLAAVSLHLYPAKARISNPPKHEEVELNAVFDVEYTGGVKMAVEAELALNWPAVRLAVMPVALSVKIEKIAGSIRVHCPPHNPNQETLRVSVGFEQEPDIVLKIESSLGHTNKIVNLPKVESLILEQVRNAISSTLVLPQELSHEFSLKDLFAIPRDQQTTDPAVVDPTILLARTVSRSLDSISPNIALTASGRKARRRRSSGQMALGSGSPIIERPVL